MRAWDRAEVDCVNALGPWRWQTGTAVMSDDEHRIQRVRDHVEQARELIERGCKRQSRRHATGTSAKLPP